MWTGLIIIAIAAIALMVGKEKKVPVAMGLGSIGIVIGSCFIAWAVLAGVLHWMGWLIIPVALIFGGYCLLKRG
jgi:hypothetical protein